MLYFTETGKEDKGVLSIDDLLDSYGDLLTFIEFQRKFHLPSNFLVFEGLVRSIKDYIFCFTFAPFLHRQENPTLTYSLLHIFRQNNNGCRYIYDKLNISNIKP